VFPEEKQEAIGLLEANKLPHAAPFRFRLRRVDGIEVWTDGQGIALQTAAGHMYGATATVTLADQTIPPLV
jgi:hypothetical protein